MRNTASFSIILAASTSFFFFSCSSSSVESDEALSSFHQTITGGVQDQNDPAVVGIVRLEGNRGGLCSGSLIAPNLVLTARHCVADSPEIITCGDHGTKFGNVHTPKSFYVTTLWNGPQKLFDTGRFSGTWYKVSAVLVPTRAGSVCGNDVAVLHLQGAGIPESEAAPLTPNLDDNVKKGDVYRAVGFGLDELGGGDSGLRRMRESLKVSCVGDCDETNLDNAFEWTGQEGVCQGDSGGPAFDDQGRVVGVVSRGMTGCREPIYGSVWAWRDWLKANGVVAAQAGHYPVPPWAQGGDGSTLRADKSDGSSCSADFDCASNHCHLDRRASYCSSACTSSAACESPYQCDMEFKVCVKDDYGSQCSSAADCRSGKCIHGEMGMYCTKACTNQTGCPSGSICSSGACLEDTLSSAGPSTERCSFSSGSPQGSVASILASLAALSLLISRARTKPQPKVHRA